MEGGRANGGLPRRVLFYIKVSMKQSAGAVAVVTLALIVPAALFMAAIFVRAAFPPALPADALVHWFEERQWTLMVLLFAMPGLAFVCGIATLAGSRSLTVLREHLATFVLTATTLTAAMILAIVVLHMGAN